MKHLLLLALLLSGPAVAETDAVPGLDDLRRAAEAGQTDAQYELGVLYEFGYRFPDYKVTAYAWYNRAAEQGNAAAAQRRDAMKANMSQAELDRAATLAVVTPVSAPTPTSEPATQAAAPVSITTPPVSSDPIQAPTPASSTETPPTK